VDSLTHKVTTCQPYIGCRKSQPTKDWYPDYWAACHGWQRHNL